jgi:beta-glucuronidase
MRIVIAALILACGTAHAQPADEELSEMGTRVLDREALGQERPVRAPTMENVLSRKRQDLSGEWRYLIDPMRAGLRKGNARRDFWRDRVADPRGDLIEYEWDSAPTIDVPGDWNAQIEHLRWYEDLLWYRHTFDAKPKPGHRYFLHFEGASYKTYPHLNGEELPMHEGGFTPFEYEVTDLLRAGDNSLVVAVDARHGRQSVPGDYTDWKNYGGITRPVHLVEVPETFIRDYRVSLSEDRAAIEIEVHLDGPDAGETDVALTLGGIAAAERTRGDGTVMLRLERGDLALWSPQTPALHPFTVRTEADAVDDRIGLRDVDVQGTQVLLNGKPIFIRGISLHEEALGEIGTRAMDDDAVRALLRHAKDLNANFVRLAHYPHNERMVRVAEEMGLMVWSEVPIYWEVIDYSSPYTMALARRMQAASIHRDYNRANIVVWSVANETPITDPRNAFLGVLMDDARAIGGDRMISAALNKAEKDGDQITVTDPLGAELDLLAVNEYEGWYGSRKLDQVPDVRWSSIYDKPMMFSEFGAGALHGYRERDATIRWSEDYQAEFYAKTLEMVEQVPNLVGISPWVLKDFRSPRRWHGRFQDYWNRKGLISETGERKVAFDVLADWYERKAEE